MVASSDKSLLFVLLIGLTMPAISGPDKVDDLEVQEKASALAKANLLRVIPVMGEAIEACDANSHVIDLPLSDEIGVSRRALLLGLDYFYRKNRNECLAPVAQRYSLAKWVYDESLTTEGEVREAIKGLELIEPIMQEWWKELEAKARYHAEVSEADRAKIESIPRLDQPFDMIHSWDASGN